MNDPSITFEVRFPIQERYYACLYSVLVNVTAQMENIQSLPMSTKVNLFTFMFSGLSSGFEILQVLSSQILRHICQQYQLCATEQPT